MDVTSQKITPFLWFDHQAEEAANFYVSLFPNSAVDLVTRYGDSGPGPKGSAMTVAFHLDSQQFTALNGGPYFKFTEAISFVVNCEGQAEVDQLWAALTEGGKEAQCGWLKDKYGLSWQIVPKGFLHMMKDTDAARKDRVMKAMMKMVKFDVAKLEAAWNGATPGE